MDVIKIDKLTKYYGKSRGIVDVSFDVNEGEIFGFIGPNGAGKSTTIRLLLGLIFPSSGSATIFGKDCIAHGPEIRRDIGYLPSEVFYYDKMKVIDLLKYSASFYKKDCTKRLHELAEIMELGLNRRIEDLSYGNKKKVGIVQGLLHEPRLIILDEPTSGLDPLMQKKFFNIIQEENQKKGATILFSSHILSEVQQICNRVGIIKEGSIIKIEDMSNLKSDNYKKIIIRTNGSTEQTGTSKVFLSLSGVTELVEEQNELRFFYKGNINILIQIISGIPIRDLRIEEPTLEEIFMHYY